MSLVAVQNLSRYYGATPILTGVEFHLSQGERVGLIGRNGEGKSTLLRILSGDLDSDEGTLAWTGSPRTALVQQDAAELPQGEVFAAALAVFRNLQEMERRLREMEAQMAEAVHGSQTSLDELMAEYGRTTDRFEQSGGYEYRAKTRAVLFGLGFQAEDLARPVSELSGGERVRVGLARALLAEPELLLLDEPTNHLDLGAIEWLEEYLQSYRGTVLVVSHDRFFLDRVVTRILELEGGRIENYSGNYTFHVAERARRLARRREDYERQQEEIARLKAYIRRYKAGNRATMAKSREKALERMQPVEAPPPKAPDMALSFAAERRSGDRVLELTGLTKAFGERVLFRQVSAQIARGERIGLLGPNGAGKSTLLKTILGTLQLDSGQIRWGAGVEPGYFSQDQSELSLQQTVLDSLLEVGEFTLGEARSLLGQFLFSGEDVFKKVGDLSGGERVRLALCRLTVSRANLLLLDEPTNHLDVGSREALEQALEDFPGTLVFVTHDRYFLRRMANRIWELTAGEFRDFRFGYEEYRERAAERREATGIQVGRAQAEMVTAPQPQRPESNRERRDEERRRERRRQELQGSLAALEQEIEEAEQRRDELGRVLSDPAAFQTEEGAEAAREFPALEERLQSLYSQWEALTDEIGALE